MLAMFQTSGHKTRHAKPHHAKKVPRRATKA
jgi:hypothetical protein